MARKTWCICKKKAMALGDCQLLAYVHQTKKLPHVGYHFIYCRMGHVEKGKLVYRNLFVWWSHRRETDSYQIVYTQVMNDYIICIMSNPELLAIIVNKNISSIFNDIKILKNSKIYFYFQNYSNTNKINSLL